MGNELARRVRENTTVEKTDREAGAPTLAQRIMQMQDEFARAMPRGGEAVQLVRDAITCLRTTPKLAECQPASVLGGLMTCAQLGLRPGVLGHAWLLPFWDARLVWLDDKGRERTGGHRAQLVIGYQGYRELAQRSGQIATVIGREVRANDQFELDYGIADNLVHKPKLDGPRGDTIGYYAIVKYTSGGYAFWYMSRDDVEEHRDRFAMARKPIYRDGKKTGETEIVGPWRDNFDEMAIKTAFLRLAKWMPKSTELASAIEADGSVRVDLAPDPDALLHGEKPPIENGGDDDGQPLSPAEVAASNPALKDLSDSDAYLRNKVVDAPADEEAPEQPVSAALAKEIVTKLGSCGVTEKDAVLATISDMVGRPVTATKQLTRIEGTRLAGALDACIEDPDGPEASLAAHLVDLQRAVEEAKP